MSYAEIGPPIYEVYQPNKPWHPGAPGWYSAPIPGWGQNPNLLDTYRKAVQGLGCGGCGCGGSKSVGQELLTEEETKKFQLDWPVYVGTAALLGLVLVAHMSSRRA